MSIAIHNKCGLKTVNKEKPNSSIFQEYWLVNLEKYLNKNIVVAAFFSFKIIYGLAEILLLHNFL